MMNDYLKALELRLEALRQLKLLYDKTDRIHKCYELLIDDVSKIDETLDGYVKENFYD
jgi:hypothetical protein